MPEHWEKQKHLTFEVGDLRVLAGILRSCFTRKSGLLQWGFWLVRDCGRLSVAPPACPPGARWGRRNSD